jgi:hypothetical protein
MQEKSKTLTIISIITNVVITILVARTIIQRKK